MHLMEVPGGLEVSNTGVQADYIDLSVLACQIPVSLNQATDTYYTPLVEVNQAHIAWSFQTEQTGIMSE